MGNDNYTVDNTSDVVTENAGEGTDTVKAYISYALGNNVENLTLTGMANIDATGNELANRLVGNDGDNVLAGGLGNDTLTGGAGTDQFVFDTAPGTGNVDRIVDFLSGVDQIVLDDLFFGSLGETVEDGELRMGAGYTSAADADDHLIYNISTGGLYFDADGNATGATAVKIATLAGTPTVNFTDFCIVLT